MALREDSPAPVELETRGEPESRARSAGIAFLRKLVPFIGIPAFLLALFVLHRTLRTYRPEEILEHLRALPPVRLLVACGFTALTFVALSGYDVLAVRYVGASLRYRQVAFVSFIAYGFSNSISTGGIVGSTLRYRLYSALGLSAFDVARIFLFCSATLWLGYLALAGALFALDPIPLDGLSYLPASTRPLGLVFLALLAAYAFWISRRKSKFVFRGFEFDVPSSRTLLFQIAVAGLDWTFSSAVLFALLPSSSELGFDHFLAFYLLAQVIAAVSHVPGGLGVFESAIVLLLTPDPLPADAVLGSLFAFRGIYYFVPLALAGIALGAREIRERSHAVRGAARALGRFAPAFVPSALALSTFLAGSVLLVSGALPAAGNRLAWLDDFLPLPVLELSHFLGSAIGAALLILARGLQRRIDAAWLLSVALLVAGIAFSLLKGLDYEEALLLAFMLALLLPCRRAFYRKASLTDAAFSPEWIVAVVLTVCGSVWLGLFSFKHVDYSHELWWSFALHGEASRFLRASVAAVAVASAFSFARLLRPAPRVPDLPDALELARVREVVATSRSASANLALIGDKRFLWSDSGRACVMFGVSGRSWIAMGDPLGPEEEWPELLWRFRELCDRHARWSVFYEVGASRLHLYLDMGLALLKLGEAARVSLAEFTLEGPERRGLRHGVRHLEKIGGTFEVLPRERVREHLAELREVSDAWLEEKHAREKGFSLGSFDEAYLEQFEIAIVRREGRIEAFANVWQSAEHEELSVDLMRYRPGAPSGVMDALLAHAMLWGREHGYRWFDLGMAPLSGLDARSVAPLWSRFGAALFRSGEALYGFEGLRHYKERFAPVWEPRYLAAPGGLLLPLVLANVTTLVSGGVKGVVAK